MAFQPPTIRIPSKRRHSESINETSAPAPLQHQEQSVFVAPAGLNTNPTIVAIEPDAQSDNHSGIFAFSPSIPPNGESTPRPVELTPRALLIREMHQNQQIIPPSSPPSRSHPSPDRIQVAATVTGEATDEEEDQQTTDYTSDPYVPLSATSEPERPTDDHQDSPHVCLKRISCHEIMPHRGIACGEYKEGHGSADEDFILKRPRNGNSVMIQRTLTVAGEHEFACVSYTHATKPAVIGFVCSYQWEVCRLLMNLNLHGHEFIGKIKHVDENATPDGRIGFTIDWMTEPVFCKTFFEFAPHVAKEMQKQASLYA